MFTLNSELGPRQRKAVKTALNAFDWEAKSFTEVSGVKGVKESRFKLTSPFGPPRPDAGEFRKEFEVYEVTPRNYKEVIAAIEAATKKLAESRPEKDNTISQEEAEERAQENEERDRKSREAQAKAEESQAKIQAKRPPWAQALIVAELHSSDCDIQTDYFSSHTTRRVAIGWRSGKREDFRQLRAAAATFPETAHLGPGCDVHEVCWPGHFDEYQQHYPGQYLQDDDGDRATFTTREAAEEAAAAAKVKAQEAMDRDKCVSGWMCAALEREPEILFKSVEHRENYSMGRGNYLQAGGTYSGWRVESDSVGGGAGCEDHLPDQGAETAPEEPAGGSVEITHNEAKHGIEIRFSEKPSQSVLDRLKAHGWRWSRFAKCWYHRNQSGVLPFACALRDEFTGGERDEGLAGMTNVDAQYEDRCAESCGA